MGGVDVLGEGIIGASKEVGKVLDVSNWTQLSKKSKEKDQVNASDNSKQKSITSSEKHSKIKLVNTFDKRASSANDKSWKLCDSYISHATYGRYDYSAGFL